jgi:hypothetical protein
MTFFLSEVEATDDWPIVYTYFFICRRFSSKAAFRSAFLIFFRWLSSYEALRFELLHPISLVHYSYAQPRLRHRIGRPVVAVWQLWSHVHVTLILLRMFLQKHFLNFPLPDLYRASCLEHPSQPQLLQHPWFHRLWSDLWLSLVLVHSLVPLQSRIVVHFERWSNGFLNGKYGPTLYVQLLDMSYRWLIIELSSL